MKLESEIKQSKFKSEREKLVVNILFTHSWLSGTMQELFKSNGITMQQYNILRILRGQQPNPSTLNLLRDRMIDKQSDVSRLVDRLLKKKLITRKPSKEDRRKMDVNISASGLKLLETMDAQADRMFDVTQALSEKEVGTVNDLLDKLRG